MGTVTRFPPTLDLATAVATLGQMTVADIEAEIGRAQTAAALEALTSIPDLIAITVRRELGGVWWDIKLQSLYFVAAELDERGHREQVTRYVWDATACGGAGGDDDDYEPPEGIMHMDHFETAAAARANAEVNLAGRGGD